MDSFESLIFNNEYPVQNKWDHCFQSTCPASLKRLICYFGLLEPICLDKIINCPLHSLHPNDAWLEGDTLIFVFLRPAVKPLQNWGILFAILDVWIRSHVRLKMRSYIRSLVYRECHNLLTFKNPYNIFLMSPYMGLFLSNTHSISLFPSGSPNFSSFILVNSLLHGLLYWWLICFPPEFAWTICHWM